MRLWHKRAQLPLHLLPVLTGVAFLCSIGGIKSTKCAIKSPIVIILSVGIFVHQDFHINIVSQEVMTEDNVPCSIDGVVFFRVKDPEKAVLEVEEYNFAITQLSQAALRDVCGKVELDTILSKREEMGKSIKSIVELETVVWGIDIIDVKIKDIQLPENMRRMMANQAEAERSRRARVILAQAEEQAAGTLLRAGKMIDQSPSAIKLRLYQTLSNIAAEKNSTILFPFPEEVLPRKNKGGKGKKG